MSTVSSTTSTTSAITTSSTSTTSNISLDFEDFVTLLATELQYQDPTDPVSATEYVTQMTQISTISQLASIYAAVNNTSAYDLIGKEVTYLGTDSNGDTVTGSGTVGSVILSGSNTYLNIDGTLVSLDAVAQVEAAST